MRKWGSLYVAITEAIEARRGPNNPQIFPRKPENRGKSTFYVVRDLIDLLMIPRKIGRLADQRGFITVRGYSNMALKKSAGATGTAKKTAAKGTAKKAAPTKKAAAPTAKKAAPKKAAGPKLSDPQNALLKKVSEHGDPAGYVAAKKPENKSLETLLKHKLVKKGKKHESGHYHYTVSKAGQKHLATPSSTGTSLKSS
jgi:hypothetical protein